MKQLVIIALFVLFWGCSSGSDDTVAGGGDDFPSMITTAGEQIARVINGDLNTGNVVPQKPDFAGIGRIRSRGFTISGDTLWVDTVRFVDQYEYGERYAFSLYDSGSIYSLDRIYLKSKGYDTIAFRDYDGDGFLYSPKTKPFSLKITARGTAESSWWYKGDSPKNVNLQRYFLETDKGVVAWFKPSGDSLAVAGDSVRLVVTQPYDTVIVDCIAVGLAETVSNDLVTSITFRYFRKGASASLRITPVEPSSYHSVLNAGTVSGAIFNNDSTHVVTGFYTEQTIAVITELYDTIWFGRSGKSLERGSK